MNVHSVIETLACQPWLVPPSLARRFFREYYEAIARAEAPYRASLRSAWTLQASQPRWEGGRLE